MVRKLKNFLHLIKAIFANLIYFFPSQKLTVFGVTGTDGKTTTVHLIGHILKQNGFRVGIISTVSAPGLHTTTPDPLVLQKLLWQMKKRGITHVVLEASSHGLDQYRLWGVNLSIGVVTNVTHDHLDYHKTWENYLKAKSKLFERCRIAVLNKDDKSYQYLKSKIKNKKSKIVTYGIKKEADFTPKSFSFKTKLPGTYNIYNCLAAAATASVLGISPTKIKKAIWTFPGVKGRMEEIKMGQKFRVFIDFAKTASGLENVLKTLRNQLRKNGRLIAVFGSAGLRDVAKRKMMGEVAGKLADIAVLTAEDPRTEDVNKIIDQIAQGCLEVGVKEKDWRERTDFSGLAEKCFFRIPDRRQAIRFAVEKLAKNNDILVFCGKGHEKSMCWGRKEYPWNEKAEVKKALKRRLKRNV